MYTLEHNKQFFLSQQGNDIVLQTAGIYLNGLFSAKGVIQAKQIKSRHCKYPESEENEIFLLHFVYYSFTVLPTNTRSSNRYKIIVISMYGSHSVQFF